MAEPGMEVAFGYNRYAQDLVPYDQKESIHVPMEVDDERKEDSVTSKKIEEMERRWKEVIKVIPSSLSNLDKTEEMVRLFMKEVEELKEKSSKKIEEGKKRLTNLDKSEDEDVILGRVIVAGGTSKKAKKKKNKKKRKAKAEGERIVDVTESAIIATIHCSDVGYCLSRNPLVTHIPYHVPSLLL